MFFVLNILKERGGGWGVVPNINFVQFVFKSECDESECNCKDDYGAQGKSEAEKMGGRAG